MATSLVPISRVKLPAALAAIAGFLNLPFIPASPPGSEPMALGGSATLSPDGAVLVFEWDGDLWRVPSAGGEAQALTRHPARESDPVFSFDGSKIAFSSDRSGSVQTYVADADGGSAIQATFHSEGSVPQDWFPNGVELLVRGKRGAPDPGSERFFQVPAGGDVGDGERPLFESFGDNGQLSPDGKKLLFTREGEPLYRKGYTGSRATQIWLYDLERQTFQKLREDAAGCRWPRWTGEGLSFYYVGAQSGSYNLRRFDPLTGDDRQLTFFVDDAVMFPVVSRDGGTVVFRRLFDYYRWLPGRGGDAERITIWNRSDRPRERQRGRLLKSADEAVFSADGLEVALTCGGSLWVMDTALREPVRVWEGGEELRSPVFSPEGDHLYAVRDAGDEVEVVRFRRDKPEEFWWRNQKFPVDALTDKSADLSSVTASPDGGSIAFVEGFGKLVVTDRDGKNRRVLLEAFDVPAYSWSPDGKWLAWAVYDEDFNRDIWIRPSDGGEPAHNVSRHPDNEDAPVWSPDGKMLAFTGRRFDNETDIFYLWLERKEAQETVRDRKLEEAVKRMKEGRPGLGSSDGATSEDAGEKAVGEGDGAQAKDGDEDGLPAVSVDFEGIHRRIRHLSIPGAAEEHLFWSPDGKKLAFSAEIDGKKGAYAVDLYAEEPKPESLVERSGSAARWLEKDEQIVWLSEGVPGSLKKGEYESYEFEARQSVDWTERRRLGFLQAWRLMRDRYYDGLLGGRDWDTVRRKYEEAAATAPDAGAYSRVMALMLGELNGSHLGFRTAEEGWKPDDVWQRVTPWLGLEFDRQYAGSGFRVATTVPDGPADREISKIEPGDVIVAVDGEPVGVGAVWPQLANGPLERDLLLRVRNAAGEEREVTIRALSYEEGRKLAGEARIRRNQEYVNTMSEGRLGYVRILSMNWPSFQDFERELYAEGTGKEGLIIDVRDNGGGFTADHLLTVLTQPRHAVTVPRGGLPGYPQDRKVYATWPHPVTVLCNQNSFSNAEIFSHAIKTLGRGKLVGTPTAGGVISTGSRKILDLGELRIPSRGWHVLDTGEDMELNGAVPDLVVWPRPGEIEAGYDRQLEAAVQVLLEEVRAEAVRPRPELRKASERTRGD